MNRRNASATSYMLDRARRAARGLKACVSAFLDEVADMVVSRSASRALVTAEGERFDLYLLDGNGEPKHVARQAGSLESAAAGFRRLLSARQRKAVALRVGSDRALVAELMLPQGVKDVLAAVIRNKIESIAPWPLEETLWGYRLSGPPRGGQIGVDVAVASRRGLNDVVRPLEACGLQIDTINAAAEGSAIPLDFRDARRHARARRVAAIALAAAFACPLTAASHGSYLLFSARSELAVVDQRIEALKLAMQRGGEAAAGTKLAEANRLHARKGDDQPFATLLAALSDLLPDEVWLESVAYANDVVTINGRGAGVPKLIETLEASSLFKEANFATATQHDEEANVDTFSISATVEKGLLR